MTSTSSAIADAVTRLQARQGEVLRRWGPLTLDPVTISRFHEAEGWPHPNDPAVVAPALLLQLGNDTVNVHEDQRPHETLDPALANPVNGGMAAWWYRWVHPAEILSGEVSIGDVSTRNGKSGPLALVTLKTTITDQRGSVVAMTTKTVIFRGVVA